MQNLFHSVQLNVNNPHFLIMQGRITKVLNMKPPEILGLLEEAAGTKMYEMKKQAALRTLDKKQVKVDEISKVLTEDIMPALDKLRKEKVQYMEWQNATANLDRLRRFCVAYKYAEAKRLQADGEGEVRGVESALSDLDALAAALELEAREKDDEIQGLQTEKELQSGGEVKELIEMVDQISKRRVTDAALLGGRDCARPAPPRPAASRCCCAGARPDPAHHRPLQAGQGHQQLEQQDRDPGRGACQLRPDRRQPGGARGAGAGGAGGGGARGAGRGAGRARQVSRCAQAA